MRMPCHLGAMTTTTSIDHNSDVAVAESPSLAFEPGRDEVLDRLVVRIAGRGDRELVADLAARAGLPEPEGALLVGILDGRLLAAVSLTNGAALRESTPNGLAAVAAVRYAVARLHRRARKPRSSEVRSQLRVAA
jgi:hypothetical protein